MPARRGAVTRAAAGQWDLELKIGITTYELRQLGADEAWQTLRDAWELRRDAMLAEWRRDRPGERPWAWWAFEADEPIPSYSETGRDAETQRLVELGVVDDAELQDRHDVEGRRVRALTGAQAGFDEI